MRLNDDHDEDSLTCTFALMATSHSSIYYA